MITHWLEIELKKILTYTYIQRTKVKVLLYNLASTSRQVCITCCKIFWDKIKFLQRVLHTCQDKRVLKSNYYWEV